MSDEASRRRIGVVVSDVACPWCFVGKRQLQQALAMTPDLDVDVRWRPFQLDASIPPGGISRQDYLDRKFGPDRAKDMYARLQAAGAQVGIPFAFDKITRSPNTLDAHRLLRWAQEYGVQDMLKERLLNLYFVEGADLGDHEILCAAAGQSGMDAQAVRARLASDEDVEAVRADIDHAQRLGVNGVPFFIIDGRYGLAGAQPAETLVAALRRAAADEPEPEKGT